MINYLKKKFKFLRLECIDKLSINFDDLGVVLFRVLVILSILALIKYILVS